MNLMTDAAGNSNIPDALNALASGDIATAGMILEMLGGILFAALVFYLIGAMARYKYLRIRSYQGAWLAFIPYDSNWAVVEATYGPKLNVNYHKRPTPVRGFVGFKLHPTGQTHARYSLSGLLKQQRAFYSLSSC